MSFYKFTRPGTVRYVAACTLRFSPACEFNDPFDGLPDTAALMAMPAYQQLKEEWTDLAKLDPAIPDLSRGAALAGELIEKKAKAAMSDHLLADLNQNFRILCLSRAAPESMGAALMFGHYADNHQGFAYEFNEEHPWFAEHEARRNPTREIGSVEYSGGMLLKVADEVLKRALRGIYPVRTELDHRLIVRELPESFNSPESVVRVLEPLIKDLEKKLGAAGPGGAA